MSDPSSRPLPRRQPSNRPRPPIMPTRSKSTLVGPPPHDAAKSDEQAVDDVIGQVDATGSIERAARKLQLYAKLTGMQPQPQPQTQPQPQPQSTSTTRPGQAGYYDPEEEEYQHQGGVNGNGNDNDNGQDEYAVEDDEQVLVESGALEGDGGRQEMEEVVHLQEIVEGLWVGDLVAAMDSEGLEERGISNIVSLLRPRLSFPSQFSVFPLEIDDSADTDILTHLPTCVAWIGEALRKRERLLDSTPLSKEDSPDREPLIRSLSATKPGGVLVHCQAGMSRSATVAAAYLMVALSLDSPDAIDMIKERRPVIDPSETFRYQLGLFHQADNKVTLRDRSTRHFYMERNATFFMNGQTSSPATDKMARYPATPTPSQPATPSGGHGRRKIRCKMCRRHLAVREHMMDHILDQAPISRPRTPSNFSLPAPLSRTSIDNGVISEKAQERRGSVVSDIVNPLTGLPGARSRQPSMSAERPVFVTSPLSPLSPSTNDPTLNSSVPFPRSSTPGLVLTAMTPVDPARATPINDTPLVDTPGNMTRSSSLDHRRSSSGGSLGRRATLTGSGSSSGRQLQSADQLASRLPPHLQALRSGSNPGSPITGDNSPTVSSPPSSPEKETSGGMINGSGGSGSSEGARTAARRRSMLFMTPTEGSRERRGSNGPGFGGEIASSGPPILVNQKCSGYFVEPLTWMEPVLKNGDISGKLICPNEKCGAKIGNFDWAGVQCGCKEWVTPGFCISRSKVDEVW